MIALEKKIKLFLLLIILTANISCSCQNTIHRKVKTAFEYDYIDRETMELKREGVLTSKETFDTSGHKFEKIYFSHDGKISSSNTYEYNKEGKCVSIKYFNKDKQLIKETKSEYDNEGNLYFPLEIISTNFCKEKSPLVKCTFDSAGQLQEAIRYDEAQKDIIVFKTTYKYEYWW